ncbi:hypothetical protein BVX98_06835 [bacterium F11]|nr:hypothetical protein BVX98_06835 [bacterium F11]
MRKKEKKTTFQELVKIMARLRAPGGCPWDREQTHQSLLRYLREESEEVCHAVQRNDMDNLKEELGDVLLQILFHAEIAEERGDFDITDILRILKKKLVSRHPHVFDKKKNKETLTADEVKKRWKIMKKKEEARKHRNLKK